MNDNVAECFANPIKCKMLLEIQKQGQATAKQLSGACGGISHATLYRYLKKMTTDGVLQIVRENKVRGMVEKVYTIADSFLVDTERMVKENDGNGYMMLFTQFVAGLTEEFREYASRADIDILRDGSGFTVAPVYATLEELTAAITAIGQILDPLYNNEKTAERDLHNIAIITTPPKRGKA